MNNSTKNHKGQTMHKPYIGTKQIRATAMNRGEYNRLRGWRLPADENPNEDGYLVEYLDSPNANVEGYEHYVSWSPADVFRRAYRPVDQTHQLTFADALTLLEQGYKVARRGWNGKDMFVFQIKIWSFWRDDFNAKPITHPFLALCTHDLMVNPWAPSQADMMAHDWRVVL